MRLLSASACALLVAASAASAATPPQLLHAGDQVGGKRVDAYPALWWQWVNRKRWGAQAYQDPTGAQCALNQSGPVWFLAGTDGSDIVHRQCHVPSGKHLFLPVITMLVGAVPGRPNDCRTVSSEAAMNNEHVIASEISVDGQRIEIAPLRIASPECFNAYEKADYLDDTSGYFPSATDGFWLMLAPLADGKHVIRVNVRYDNRSEDFGDMEQVFEYQLEVGGPEPAPGRDDEEQPPQDDGEWRQA